MGMSEKTFSDQHIIDTLNARRGKIISKTGGWFPGKGVFSHGYSMMDDLVGKKSYFQIVVLNATGKMVSAEFAHWIEVGYSCLSWPDPRIWCNQIGALAGSVRTSAIAATAMGVLATDSRTYGVYPLKEGVQFIQAALASYRQGLSAEQIVANVPSRGGKPLIVGYIRPIAKGDERIRAMASIAEGYEFPVGPHLELAMAIERVLQEKYDEGMNVNGYVSAVMADHGFSPDEVYQIFTTLVASGVTACYLDTFHQAPDTFLPLRCDDIDYQGVAVRPIPDSQPTNQREPTMQKTALVTGGNSGIGYATAKLLKARGYAVTISGRNAQRVADAAAELGVEAVVADMANPADVARLASHFQGKALSALVNNAGIARFIPVQFCSAADFDEVMNTNVRGPLDLIKGLLPALEKAKGSITNVSSAVVNNGLANAVLYAASKGALEAATKSLAIELAQVNVRVNAVSPGAIDTPIITKFGLDEQTIAAAKAHMETQIPLRRYGKAEEVAEIIAAQLESSYTTGAIWAVDGGVNAT